VDSDRSDQVSMGNVSVAILAGGSGTRLWPQSRAHRPKQLMPLFGGRSLLQRTIDRVLPLVPAERIYILTGPDHADAIARQLPELPPEHIMIEPSPRGTAPALGLAAMRLNADAPPDGVMISLHADHIVGKEDAFRDALRASVQVARSDHLVTVGIIPTYPETGYGYIERGEPLMHCGDLTAYEVSRFREKPPLQDARQYVQSGRFYWNSGYFAWTYERILEDLRRYVPRTFVQILEMLRATHAHDEERFARLWEEIEPISIDVGVMERAERVAVVPADLGWSDVGNWASIHALMPKDENGNVVLGEGQHVGLDTEDSLIYAGTDKRLVTTVGLRDLIVVDSSDALLIVTKDRVQDVSRLVQMLREQGLDSYA